MSSSIARGGLWTLAVTLWTTHVPVASGAGINLYWEDCGTGGGATNRTFACNTNDGYHDLYISIDPPPGVTLAIGHNHIIELQSPSSPLPAWWEFKNPGSCRMPSLTGSADFSTGPSGGAGCVDPWQGQGVASVAAYNMNFNGDPSRVRIVGSVSVAADLAGPMNPGTEYYSIKLRINSIKTVGTDACGGCMAPVCMMLYLVRIAQPPGTPGGDIEVSNPLVNNYVTWQGASLFLCFTPTVNRTWGQVKSLYR